MTESVFSVNGWQLVFTLCNLLLDYFILKKFLYNPVKKMFALRQKEVEDVYAKADEAQTAALTMKTQYEEKMASAKEEADEIVRSATGRAQLRSDAMIAEARDSAADIIKRAMVRVDRRLAAEGLPARLILQVHDELIVEAHQSVAEKVKTVLQEEMEGAVALAVPLTVGIGEGTDWLTANH